MSSNRQERCLVCDDVSIGVNFGVPTCMPCKAFFRRNAVKLGVKEYICQKDGDCSVTYKNGRSCNCCRLAKCFRVGMNKSMIRSDKEREARNEVVKMNRLKRAQEPSSTLLRMRQSSVQCLSSSDQVILANILHAYEITCIATAKQTEVRCFPTVEYKSMNELFNDISSMLPVYIEYFKHIPEFANINMDDKLRLVKNHFGIMIHLNELLMHPHPLVSNNLITSWINIFGSNIAAGLLKFKQIAEQYTTDPILLKIVLIVLVLCTSNARNIGNTDLNQICDDTLSIFAAQCIYVELLWKYILSRSSTEANAVKFLNKFIMFILYVQKLDFHIDSYVNNLKDEVQQMPLLMQNMYIKS